MATASITANGNGFLTEFNNSKVPRIYITAETDTTDDFDQKTLRAWRDEGFEVIYLPYGNGGKAFSDEIRELGNKTAFGEYFAVVAFGDAAGTCLDLFRRPFPRCCALIAYYPSSIPDVRNSFPVSLRVLVHLAGTEVGVSRNPEILGIQGKRKTVRKTINPGLGAGGLLKLAYPAYTYEDVEPGFAERDLDEYDAVAERLAWARSLEVMRKAFRLETQIERIWDEHVEFAFKTKDVDKTLATLSYKPYLNNVPTMTGGLGRHDLARFYKSFFITSHPPSLSIQLVSRTLGVDRVVDELFVKFKHTQEVPWILPGIPPTNKDVEVAIVSIVAVRGGKLAHEHVYWDQASVLVQVGLLDPKLVPEAMRKQGVERLPVVGREGARKVMNEQSSESNALIDRW